MFWLDALSRIVHVSTAIVLIGGMVFSRFVLLPMLQSDASDSTQRLAQAIHARWKRFVHVGILLFLLSGFYNYFQAMGNHQGDGLYHAMLGVKMLLAFTIFFLASVLVGQSPKFEAMRQKRRLWLSLLILMAGIIVAISGFLKTRGVPQTEPASAEVSQASAIAPSTMR